MSRKKDVRLRGKIKLSEYFKKLKNDDVVAIKREISVGANFPERMQGRTGVVVGKKGRVYVVKIKDSAREKEYLVEAVHLKKLK